MCLQEYKESPRSERIGHSERGEDHLSSDSEGRCLWGSLFDSHVFNNNFYNNAPVYNALVCL